MAFQVSPGVQIKEIDLTNVVPAVSTSIGGYVGDFNWGPVEEITTVGSEKELASVFGTPNDVTARSFLTAASFLKYGNALKVVRALAKSGSTTHLNATSGEGTSFGLLIKNRSQYEDNYIGGSAAVGAWGAKYPGRLGNSLKVSVCPASGAAFTAWAYKGEFTSAPGTSDFAAITGASNDELHIVVVDEDGAFTGGAGTLLEKFEFVSQASNAVKADGTSNYYKNVLNNSQYVWWLDHPTELSDAGETAAGQTYTTGSAALDYSLSGGTGGVATDVQVVKAEILSGLQLFADAETIDVNLLFAGADANGETDIASALITLAEARKDVVVFLSPAIEDTVGSSSPAADVKAWADTLSSSSYAVLDSTALKVYDKYNDVYRWIPACGHVAGLCANTDEVADAWFSPAGLNRGQLFGITKVAFNPKQADRDTLYKARVNPICSFPGQGTLLYGDKTALAKPSAFDRINVRRLFIVMEKAIATAAKFQLFEFNDEFTRAQFRNLVEPFLRDVQGRRGLTDFLVVCDETNNTGDVIDRNEFRADIYVKPARSINFITLNFIATRTGVEFSEIVGK
jgi:phage tail sheath protein FI